MRMLYGFSTVVVYVSGEKSSGAQAASLLVPHVPRAGLRGHCSNSSTEGIFVCSAFSFRKNVDMGPVKSNLLLYISMYREKERAHVL